MNSMTSMRVRSHRTDLKEKMIVDSYTIGTTVIFPFLTENISKSGLLLSWDGSYPAPFQEKTILQLVIDTQCTYFDEPVACLAQVVRKLDSDPLTSQYGVRIIQIDPKDQLCWEVMVHTLESQESHQQVEKLIQAFPMEENKAS